MASSAVMKLAYAIVMCMVVVAPQAEAAISCGLISGKLAGCLRYISSGAPAPSPACCAGIKQVIAAATTPADRKAACYCLKSASGRIRGLNFGKAASLPGKCGVRISYSISPSTNCNAVH